MKQQQINKLYNKLTPQEQANLAFAASMRTDQTEVDLILSAVEKRTYVTTHVDYDRRTCGLVKLSGIFGIFYWKTLLKLSTANLSKVGMACDKVSQRYINQFIALNTALNNVCQSLQIDSEAIRKFAECSGINPKFEGVPDEEFLEQYTKLFTVAVNA